MEKTISVEFTKKELEHILSYFVGDYEKNIDWIFKVALAHDKLRQENLQEGSDENGVDEALKQTELAIGMTLQEAVEKQIPKRAVIPFDSINQEYECPVCLHWVHKNQQYCDICGQALEW